MISRVRLALSQLGYGVTSYPARIRRVVSCIVYPLLRRYDWSLSIVDYVCHLVLLVLDLVLIGEWLTFINVLLKRSCRSLTDEEINILVTVYGPRLDYHLVVIDSRAVVMTRRYALAYVSWHMVNYWQHISSAILVHEYMHVLQYQQMGSVYIYEALKAQRSVAGYNYGGAEALHQSMLMGGQLSDFNLEQQAEIMEDIYRSLQRDGALSQSYAFFLAQSEGLYA